MLYLDESGDETHEYRIMGGIAIHEHSEYHLSNSIDTIQRDFFPEAPYGEVWFHATDISAHKGEPWKSMNTETRNAVMQRVFDSISDSYTPQIVCFGVALHKPSFPDVDPDTRTFEEVCNRFDLFLRKLYAQGDRQKGLVVLSKPQFEQKFPKLLAEYHRAGTRYGTLISLLDVPLFTSSRASRMLQVADFVTWAVFRRYERGQILFLEHIIHKFDREDKVIHGLVHLTTNRNCMCHYCITR